MSRILSKGFEHCIFDRFRCFFDTADNQARARCPHGTRATPACATSRQTTHMSSVSPSVNVAVEYCSIEHLSAAELAVGF